MLFKLASYFKFIDMASPFIAKFKPLLQKHEPTFRFVTFFLSTWYEDYPMAGLRTNHEDNCKDEVENARRERFCDRYLKARVAELNTVMITVRGHKLDGTWLQLLRTTGNCSMDNLSGGIRMAKVRCIWFSFTDLFRHCLHSVLRLGLQSFAAATDVLAHLLLCRLIRALENSIRNREGWSLATGSISSWFMAAGHCLPELEHHKHVCSARSIHHCRSTTVSMELGMSGHQGQSRLYC